MYLVNTALILITAGWEVVQARYFWISPRIYTDMKNDFSMKTISL